MQLAGKNVLVTGGAGFIGSHLVEALQGCRVRVLDNFSTGKSANLAHLPAGAVEVIDGDVREPERALRGIDVVFHLACRGVRHSIGNPVENHEVNATGALALLEAARRANVQRFIHVSSSEVYGTARYAPMDEEHPCFPETIYGAAKLAGEAYARASARTYGLPVVVVRPFNNFGPRSHHEGDAGKVIPRFLIWALNGRPPIIFGDGTQTRDFIYVADTAYWLTRIAECDALVGQTINLGSGIETSVRELAELVLAETGQTALAPRHLPARQGDVHRHLACSARKETLGFHTRTPVREGIRRVIDHLRTRSVDLSAMLAEIPEVNWNAAD